MGDNDPLFREAGFDEVEAGFDGAVEVAVAEGEGDFFGEIVWAEVVEPGFFDDDRGLEGSGLRIGWLGETAGGFETVFAEFFDDFAFGDEELTGFEVGAGAGGIFPGFLGEAGEGIVDPEVFR